MSQIPRDLLWVLKQCFHCMEILLWFVRDRDRIGSLVEQELTKFILQNSELDQRKLNWHNSSRDENRRKKEKAESWGRWSLFWNFNCFRNFKGGQCNVYCLVLNHAGLEEKIHDRILRKTFTGTYLLPVCKTPGC